MSTFSTARLEAVQSRLESDVASGQIPGAAIIIGHRDHILFERHLGFSNTATGQTVRPDTVWRIFSMTKPLVTVAAMVLVERGLLRLDQQVAEFVHRLEICVWLAVNTRPLRRNAGQQFKT